MNSILVYTISFLIGITSVQKPKMVFLSGGTFSMGSDNPSFPDEKPVHSVTIDSFYISKTEVLFDDYVAFCRFAGLPEPVGENEFPVTNITWESAVMYCNWLSGMEGLDLCYTLQREKDKIAVSCDFTKNGYRLPTEAEWEYAARGGVRDKGFKYCGSNDPFKVGFFTENAKGLKQKGGQLEPNQIGLYDFTGNVAEWCWDIYEKDYYSKSPGKNPTGPATGSLRTYRGGSIKSKINDIENSRRASLGQNEKDLYVGFRLARTRL